jgi:hypothetical protein
MSMLIFRVVDVEFILFHQQLVYITRQTLYVFYYTIGKSCDELICRYTPVYILGYRYEAKMASYLFCKDKHLSTIVSSNNCIDMLFTRMLTLEDLTDHDRVA